MTKNQLSLYWNTLRFMRFKQIRYRVYYTLRERYRRKKKFKYNLFKDSKSKSLRLEPSIYAQNLLTVKDQKKTFCFLHLSHSFEDKIDWNYSHHGKLWTYNLNYFEYLLQEKISDEDGIRLIEDFIKDIDQNRDGLEPFPISLRGINWIKFLSCNKIDNQMIDDSLYAQYYILMDNLEYHLLGNHLLENGFSLLYGAYYFHDQKLFDKAKEILSAELQEQILSDGAHFELTPMYHQIMLFRLLDCYNLMSNNRHFIDKNLEKLLKEMGSAMLGWLKNMTLRNGQIPHLNDSTDGIAPASEDLFDYAKRLHISVQNIALKESGYRKFITQRYEFIADVGNIGPDYIPGHAHSDTFTFELYVDQKPVVVDTGISTYEVNKRRLLERSTKAHNTVEINGTDQSEVWSSFRVASRAKIIEREEGVDFIAATHDGYKQLGLLHKRKFSFSDKQIQIIDSIIPEKRQMYHSVAYVHFAPEAEIQNMTENSIITKNAIFTFEGLKNLELVDISIAKGYNKLIKSKAAKIIFEQNLLTLIDVTG